MRILLCFLVALAGAAETVPIAPVVDADGTLRNAATFAAGPELAESEPLHLALTVRNPHDRAVQLKLLDKTCTCLGLELQPRFLLPGASGTLAVTVENLRRSGDQRMGVTIYWTDPELAPVELELLWRVRPHVAVDVIKPGADPQRRPDAAWRDISRLTAHERPDEPQRLRKRIRLSCGDGETPADGLRIDGIDYAGRIWAFSHEAQRQPALRRAGVTVSTPQRRSIAGCSAPSRCAANTKCSRAAYRRCSKPTLRRPARSATP